MFIFSQKKGNISVMLSFNFLISKPCKLVLGFSIANSNKLKLMMKFINFSN